MSANATPSPVPFASATVIGVVSLDPQTFGGAKTVQDGLTVGKSQNADSKIVITNTNAGTSATSHLDFIGASSRAAYLYQFPVGYGTPSLADQFAIHANALNGMSFILGGDLGTPSGFHWKTYDGISAYIDLAQLDYAGTLSLNRATGNDAIKLLDGARFNFSTADASAYFYRSAANTIRTPGDFNVGGVARFDSDNTHRNNAINGYFASVYPTSISGANRLLAMYDNSTQTKGLWVGTIGTDGWITPPASGFKDFSIIGSFTNGSGTANNLYLFAKDYAGGYTAADMSLTIQANTKNVGIGTTTPNERLDVTGNGKFSGTLTANSGFTTSAATGLSLSGAGNTAAVYSGANGLTIDVNGSAVFAWGTAAMIPLGSQQIGTSGLRFTAMFSSGAFNTNVASGSDAFKSVDGARINLSTADASAYLYRSAANTIRTPGSMTVDGSFSACFGSGAASFGNTVLVQGPYIWMNGGGVIYLDVGGTKSIGWDGANIATNAGTGFSVADKFTLASYTDDSATPGNRTVNKVRGKNAFAIGGAAVTITNSFVTANSQVICTLEFADVTLTQILNCIPAAGSFVVTGNIAATAATKFSWTVIN